MLWLMFLFFLMLAWIWVIIGVISDIFRSKDLGGWGKGFWSLFIIIIPWLGVLCYLIAHNTNDYPNPGKHKEKQKHQP
jgi:hypothetical protein